MRLVLQRVRSAAVEVDGECVGAIGPGLLVLVGLATEDGAAEREWALRKILGIRLFADDAGKLWARGVQAAGLEVLLVSQFTLHAVLKGHKPDFHRAMGPELARAEWDALTKAAAAAHRGKIQTGIFSAMMQVCLQNDGPVTIELDSAAAAAPPPKPPPAPSAAPTPAELFVVLELPRAFAALSALERRLDRLRLTGLRMRGGGTPTLAARFECACADTAELEHTARAALDGAAAAPSVVVASPYPYGAKPPPELGGAGFLTW